MNLQILQRAASLAVQPSRFSMVHGNVEAGRGQNDYSCARRRDSRRAGFP
jgi:hypothetical protein